MLKYLTVGGKNKNTQIGVVEDKILPILGPIPVIMPIIIKNNTDKVYAICKRVNRVLLRIIAKLKNKKPIKIH